MAKSAPSQGPKHAGGHLWRVAAHSFRQPAQALALLADGITSAQTEAERKALSVRIAQVASGLGEMIDAMSLLARVETGEQPLTFMAMSLTDSIGAVLADHAEVAARASERITGSQTEVVVVADPALLKLAVRGSLLSALRASHANGPIEIAVERRAAFVALTFGYAGRDPAPALAEQAFVDLPQGTGDGVRSLHGIGLAFVSRLAVAMGGSVETATDQAGRRWIALLLPAAPR